MPPHCDTRDGPVAKACREALRTGNIHYVLIWIPEASETELKAAFERVLVVREAGDSARELADDWFFETAIRLHRASEGAPYTGLKPAGLDEGPVVPRAEHAIETGDPGEVIRFINQAVVDDLKKRFGQVMATRSYNVDDVKAGRVFIQAYINFVVYSHHLYMNIAGSPGQGEHHN